VRWSRHRNSALRPEDTVWVAYLVVCIPSTYAGLHNAQELFRKMQELPEEFAHWEWHYHESECVKDLRFPRARRKIRTQRGMTQLYMPLGRLLQTGTALQPRHSLCPVFLYTTLPGLLAEVQDF
jgi:hypothetical protein